jgi:hypothetical protein
MTSSSSSSLARKQIAWEASPIGQDAQGAVGACATACLYVAHMFCALPRHIETPDPALLSNRLIAACMHWKTFTRRWQSIREALMNSLLLRMAIVGKDRCITPHAAHRARNTHLDVLQELIHPNFIDDDGRFAGEKFAQPACALFCDGTYTYMLCKRFQEQKGRIEYFLFDPHGLASVVKGFRTAEDCAAFLREHCDLHERTEKTWDWNWVLCTQLPPSLFRELEKAHAARSNKKQK